MFYFVKLKVGLIVVITSTRVSLSELPLITIVNFLCRVKSPYIIRDYHRIIVTFVVRTMCLFHLPIFTTPNFSIIKHILYHVFSSIHQYRYCGSFMYSILYYQRLICLNNHEINNYWTLLISCFLLIYSGFVCDKSIMPYTYLQTLCVFSVVFHLNIEYCHFR